ncbi:MAG: PIN domain-containing protein [Candidatus Schekmanbacteria bacterium]|nr:PIN domain-containing protein [Candidatus Schekmanbacteria bacterium]
MRFSRVINNLLIDAGPLIAVFNKSDKHHHACITFLSNYHGDILTTEPVLTEVVYLLRRFPSAPQNVIDFIINAPIKLVPFSEERLLRCSKLMEQYANVPMDFADASLVAMGEEFEISDVFTLDSDFSIYRMGKGIPFKIHS